MNRLWAPWRKKYITAKKSRGCIFCAGKKNKKERYVVLQTNYSLVMLNIFPYNNGHLLISPLRHVSWLAELKDFEILDLFKTLNTAKKLLDKVLKPQGYNIGINLGQSAGAGIPRHLHIHLVPRWKGDTNFMPVFSETKVISQALDELYDQLKHAQPKTNQRV